MRSARRGGARWIKATESSAAIKHPGRKSEAVTAAGCNSRPTRRQSVAAGRNSRQPETVTVSSMLTVTGGEHLAKRQHGKRRRKSAPSKTTTPITVRMPNDLLKDVRRGRPRGGAGNAACLLSERVGSAEGRRPGGANERAGSSRTDSSWTASICRAGIANATSACVSIGSPNSTRPMPGDCGWCGPVRARRCS